LFDGLEIIQRDDLKNQIGAFDYCFHIINPEQEMGTDTIKPVAKWCGDNFQHNFVIIQFSSLLVAGGCMDLKNSWRPEWDYFEEVSPMIKYFELRCHSDDAILFKLSNA
jgi:hypothetical protein